MKNRIQQVALIFILVINFNISFAQSEEFPNVSKDLVDEKPFWGTMNFEFTISGYTAGSIEGMYIKPNFLFVRANGGLSFVNNLDYKELENAKHEWWSPIGNLEVGYPFRLGIKNSKAKWIEAQRTYSNRKNETFRQTDYYKINIPQHFLLTPVLGLNFEPVPFRIQEIANPENEFIFNQRILTLNAGVRLIRLLKADLVATDSKTGKKITGSALRFGGFYAGLDFALNDMYETSPDFTNIMKAEGLNYEFYFSIPSGFVNTIAYLEIGLKSVPYVRRNLIANDGSANRTNGSYQFFFAFKSYF